MTPAFANATRETRFEPRGLRSMTKAGKGSSSPLNAKNSSHGVRAAEELVAVGGRGSGEAGVLSWGMMQEMSLRCQPRCTPARVGGDPDGLARTLTPCSPAPPAHAIPQCASCKGAGVSGCRGVRAQGCRGTGVSGCRGAVRQPLAAAPVPWAYCAGKKALPLCGGAAGGLCPRGAAWLPGPSR